MTIRTFIALPLPKDTANLLGDAAAKMSYQDKSGAISWVDQENYHVTLAFLGEQRHSDVDQLADKLDENLLQNEFTVEIQRLSPFPETKPKLIAALLASNDDLAVAHQQVISSLNSLGMIYDKRRFYPHVTLGRLRHTRNQFAGSIGRIDPHAIAFDEVVMYESILTSSGAEYEPLYRYPLELLDISDY